MSQFDHLNLIDTTAITRDANGNTGNQNGFDYTYNPYNRPTITTKGTENVGQYQYNALGQRIQKTLTRSTTSYNFVVTRQDLRKLKNALSAAARSETLSTACTTLDTYVDNELN